ncbi:GyrI-like domain-containing protein [Paenibacillus kobensis]|uniref:GyrI-like domain-containing protein n=1 Tax=Paenibacillus kobensis TaxID=59841 RepID=UPI000FDBB285|nr:GyrI-like domain-containing protein [Paenibacillus kobensis]
MNEATITTIEKFRLASLGCTGPVTDMGTQVNELWERFVHVEPEREWLQEGYYCAHIPIENIFSFHIGRVIKDRNDVPSQMETFIIQKHSYATVRHQGPESSIIRTYHLLFKWIKKQGLQRDPFALQLEYHQTTRRTGIEILEFDIFIPLKGENWKDPYSQ